MPFGFPLQILGVSSTWTAICRFSSPIHWELGQRQGSQDWKQCSDMGCQHLQAPA